MFRILSSFFAPSPHEPSGFKGGTQAPFNRIGAAFSAMLLAFTLSLSGCGSFSTHTPSQPSQPAPNRPGVGDGGFQPPPSPSNYTPSANTLPGYTPDVATATPIDPFEWANWLAEADARPLPPPIQRARSLWVPVPWSSLPGLATDPLHGAWNAWLKSCERPNPTWADLCRQVRLLALADDAQQRRWLLQNLQPYRIANPDGTLPDGLLTGYFEPLLPGSRQRTAQHTTPLYAMPAGRSNSNTPWFTRRDIDTHPSAQAALQGRELAWLADPIDALILHIQGSGRIQLQEADGQIRTIRLAFAGHNGHAYRSPGRWLIDQANASGSPITDLTWPGIKQWVSRNPQRLNDLLWSNPRYVFFREEALTPMDAQLGPKGAQGVPLTPERSIAIDPGAVPYGTPIWLSANAPLPNSNAAATSPRYWQRLVLAQDTGAAITGPARADYFAGWGDNALNLIASLKHPVQLWALWPIQAKN